jgi:hypothetical protein
MIPRFGGDKRVFTVAIDLPLPSRRAQPPSAYQNCRLIFEICDHWHRKRAVVAP